MNAKEPTSGNLKLAHQWRSSGMTQTDFASSQQISIHTLRYWLYKRKDSLTEKGSFLRIKDFSTVNEIILRYPGGVELRLPSATPLSVIKQLVVL